MITVVRFGFGNSAAIEIASSRLGMDSITSTMRIRTVSTQPPNAPASSPMTIPTDQPDQRRDHADQKGLLRAEDHAGEEVAAEVVAAEREPRLRPGDVAGPQLALQLGEDVGRPCGAINGASTATTRNTPTITAPMIATGLRRSRANASAVRLRPAASIVDAGASAALPSVVIIGRGIIMTAAPAGR